MYVCFEYIYFENIDMYLNVYIYILYNLYYI